MRNINRFIPDTAAIIHKNADDKWCFWDETWSIEIGSYATEMEAGIALANYVTDNLGVDITDTKELLK